MANISSFDNIKFNSKNTIDSKLEIEVENNNYPNELYSILIDSPSGKITLAQAIAIEFITESTAEKIVEYPYVYITRTGTKYHISKTCKYIDDSVTTQIKHTDAINYYSPCTNCTGNYQ